MAMLLPAVSAARQYVKVSKANVEVHALESSLRKYLLEYKRMPDTMPLIPDPENTAVPIQGDLAKIITGQDINNQNPKKFEFITFNDYNSVTDDPVTPWARKGITPGQDDLYYIKFDNNFDNVINGTGSADDPPEKTVNRKIIVWCLNPKKNKKDPKRFIKSW